ncbi:hypothetical protein [Nocardiopsis salina]|uniref:hypothetical protein n=1 Tax=Nocardiopsis salina TaxID=245836 RepID=UPI0003615A93|nr:hypothetical protein [Nocardiopsis salina]
MRPCIRSQQVEAEVSIVSVTQTIMAAPTMMYAVYSGSPTSTPTRAKKTTWHSRRTSHAKDHERQV